MRVAARDGAPHDFRVKRTLLALALIAAAVPTRLAAQQELVITVRDAGGRPLADVELTIPSIGRRTTTDSVGRGRFTNLERGSYAIRARRVGYDPVAARAQVDPDSPPLALVLHPRTVMLDTIKVIENCPWRGFSGFDCRQRLGRGLFLDYVAIDSSNVDDVAKLFYDRPGWKVYRRAGSGIPYVVSTEGWRCLVEIVDGMPIARTNPMPVYTHEILGVEAYVEGKLVPKDYEKYSWKRGYRCGLINWWTVRGNR